MRRLVILVGALGACVGVAVAVAATTTVALTERGPQPSTVTVEWGDTVVFQNTDAVARKISISRLGVTSQEVLPGASFEQRFAVRAGNYPVRQQSAPTTGMVVVKVSGTLTLTAPQKPVPVGTSIRLAGRSTQAGAQVTIQRRLIGERSDWEPLATVDPDGSGAFSIAVKMEQGAFFRALAADGQVRSLAPSVNVVPRITARTLARRVRAGARATIVARVQPAGVATAATLERWDAKQKIWRNEVAAAVSKSGRAVFKWEAEVGPSRLRVSVRRGSLAPGFDSGSSNNVAITGLPPG